MAAAAAWLRCGGVIPSFGSLSPGSKLVSLAVARNAEKSFPPEFSLSRPVVDLNVLPIGDWTFGELTWVRRAVSVAERWVVPEDSALLEGKMLGTGPFIGPPIRLVADAVRRDKVDGLELLALEEIDSAGNVNEGVAECSC
ncbi:hypothetical protein O1611_g3116 [Lasiodiplodia mahajangana]|uniref:Uncharacterized protein n=1 Tax=Lasiodiplodia mahajangana TaxID=1108764 RepID=A0ACC2JSX6_9PEZI|nr:hypothetical protein O1611_g3116 [Lasiodiplodia mahajangana]